MIFDRIYKTVIPDYQNTGDPAVRGSYGRLAGQVGIGVNSLLFILKLIIGLFTGSIMILGDAFDNLSDFGASVITLLGYKLSARPADREHPFGHGRMEYMCSFIVSVCIIVVGIEVGQNAVQKIIHPREVTFTRVVLLLLGLSFLLKLLLLCFYRSAGKKIDSDLLKATARDSLNDIIVTGAVLCSVAFMHLTGINIDAYLGLCVAVFILVSGVLLARDTISPLLGEMPKQELVDALSEKVLSYDGITGIHDLVIHSYGPGRCFASLHCEVPASVSVTQSHDVIDTCEREVGRALGLDLVIHMDPVATDDVKTNEMRDKVSAVIRRYDKRLSIHDFRMVEGVTHTNVIFDVVVPLEYNRSEQALRDDICAAVAAEDPMLHCVIRVDRNYTLGHADTDETV